MKRLLLLRHAKAAVDTGGGDHARGLAPRGQRAAPAMGQAMRKARYMPDLVLCSDAERTKQTWALVAPELKGEPRIVFSEALYLAPWNAIIKALCAVPSNPATVLVIGHNPGLEDCAAALLRTSANGKELDRREAMTEKFPTAALAVLDCDIDGWDALAPGKAKLVDFLKPRDLEA